MKKILLILLSLALLSACTSSNEFGECIGIDGDKKPDLIYKLSIKNLVLGVIFVELIVPPIVVLAEQTYCPVGKKAATH